VGYAGKLKNPTERSLATIAAASPKLSIVAEMRNLPIALEQSSADKHTKE
jgi:hypothetical protein